MRHSIVSLCWLTLAIGFMLSHTATATMIIPATLESMSHESDAIVVGTVKSRKGYWEEGNIYTDIIIEVQEVIKQHGAEEPPSEISLKQLGGTVGEIRQEIDGSASFEAGEKAMLFLNAVKKSPGKYSSFGLSYGVYKIKKDRETQQEMLHGPYFEYTEHVDLKSKKSVSVSKQSISGASKDELKELRTFIKEIKQQLKEEEKQGLGQN